jgi:hypothetical protein
VKKFLRPRHIIYMGGGGTFKNLPRFNRCEIYGGRVSTPTFQGWRFLPEFIEFRGNGSSESTHFPEGLVLGNSIKPCHPRNVSVEIDKTYSRNGCRKKVQIHGKRVKWRILTKFRMFHKFSEKHGNNGRTRPLCLNFRSVSGYAILAKVWNQEIAEVWDQEVAGIRRSRTGEALESRTFEPTRSDLRNSGVTNGGLGNQ